MQPMMRGPELGVCYYPEQWPEEKWAEDARQMKALGLTWVRIGEFAWSQIEPQPGQFDWGWLDRAIDCLGTVGLKVIMSTPTAAPPKWLIDLYPDILPVGPDGLRRKFGSRRHYCFSSRRYRLEAARIATEVASRYGDNPSVHAWQIDNEYGDHDTIHSYSDDAQGAFRNWLKARYGSIDALNRAWGTTFWSMTYNDFEQVELPIQLVEEPSPSHLLDYFRFSSDQVISFNRIQVDILRAKAPGRPITHNYMNQNTDFNHHLIGKDLDIASWDAYPLGNLIHGRLSQAEKARYLRTGDPDQPSFNNDLYRSVGRGRVWIMEQQPGPVNWADQNLAPMDGMVRLWTWLAFAHGCEMVSYFRWRQAPFAQEQYHTGLLLPDSTPDQAFHEIAQVIAEAAKLPAVGQRQQASVALVLDYQSRWALTALPQGRNFEPAHHALDWYSAMRRHGVDVDIVGQDADISGYKLIVAPDLVVPDPSFVTKLQLSGAKAIFGPRSGSKTADFHVPDNLPIGPIAQLVNVRVVRVESLPDWHTETVIVGNCAVSAWRWRETIETSEMVLGHFQDSYRDQHPAYVGNDRFRYLATLPDPSGLRVILQETLEWAGISTCADLGDLRLSRRGPLTFAFNFGPDLAAVPAPTEAVFHLGDRTIARCGVAAWSVPETPEIQNKSRRSGLSATETGEIT